MNTVYIDSIKIGLFLGIVVMPQKKEDIYSFYYAYASNLGLVYQEKIHE